MSCVCGGRSRWKRVPPHPPPGETDVLISRVIGEVVATQKHASHEGRKILLVQPLNLDGSNRGDALVALDSVDAGVGDLVLLARDGFRLPAFLR